MYFFKLYHCSVYSSKVYFPNCIIVQFIFPKCIFPKCTFPKCILPNQPNCHPTQNHSFILLWGVSAEPTQRVSYYSLVEGRPEVRRRMIGDRGRTVRWMIPWYQVYDTLDDTLDDTVIPVPCLAMIFQCAHEPQCCDTNDDILQLHHMINFVVSPISRQNIYKTIKDGSIWMQRTTLHNWRDQSYGEDLHICFLWRQPSQRPEECPGPFQAIWGPFQAICLGRWNVCLSVGHKGDYF